MSSQISCVTVFYGLSADIHELFLGMGHSLVCSVVMQLVSYDYPPHALPGRDREIGGQSNRRIFSPRK